MLTTYRSRSKYENGAVSKIDASVQRLGCSPVPIVDKGYVAALADDDVVEGPHADDIADFAQASGDLEILLRRRRVARRVVVDEDDRRGGVADDMQEDVARMNDGCGERPFGNEDVSDLAVFVVPQFIERLYLKRFGRTRPEVVIAVEDRAGAELAKKEARQEARRRARAAKDGTPGGGA